MNFLLDTRAFEKCPLTVVHLKMSWSSIYKRATRRRLESAFADDYIL